ncbi:hypothetical protein OSTOST_10563 [Ostertagia ostertagi]
MIEYKRFKYKAKLADETVDAYNYYGDESVPRVAETMNEQMKCIDYTFNVGGHFQAAGHLAIGWNVGIGGRTLNAERLDVGTAWNVILASPDGYHPPLMTARKAAPLQTMVPTSQIGRAARTRRRMERKEEKGEVEDANLVLRSVIMKADGSIQVLGEESYSVTTTYYNGRTTHTRTTYYYNDIMAMEIGSDGEMRWVKKIPKSQAGMSGRGGMSFKSFNYNGDTYFFFMDHKKNLDIKKDETPATHSDGAGGILMAVRIDQDGNMKKDAIFDVREDKLTLTVSDFKRVDNHQIMAGKIDYILVSGDNGDEAYNEPETMQADLLAGGIPPDRIILDYAGFRTLDSIVRCKEVFGEDNIIVISQQFHNERALFIARYKDIDAIGFNATDISMKRGFMVQAREKLARVKMALDLLVNKEPKFYGPKIRIG